MLKTKELASYYAIVYPRIDDPIVPNFGNHGDATKVQGII